MRANSGLLPIPIDDVLKSLSDTVTIEFDCPKPANDIDHVTIKVTTSPVAWDPAQAEAGTSGTYKWNPKSEVKDGKKTITATNWLMMDPTVMAREEGEPPIGPIMDEGLLYHELLHGQLQMDYMSTQAFRDEACKCHWTERSEASQHESIFDALNEYYKKRIPGISVKTIEAAGETNAGGDFKIDMGPANKRRGPGTSSNRQAAETSRTSRSWWKTASSW